jgi:hypothetical protein
LVRFHTHKSMLHETAFCCGGMLFRCAKNRLFAPFPWVTQTEAGRRIDEKRQQRRIRQIPTRGAFSPGKVLMKPDTLTLFTLHCTQIGRTRRRRLLKAYFSPGLSRNAPSLVQYVALHGHLRQLHSPTGDLYLLHRGPSCRRPPPTFPVWRSSILCIASFFQKKVRRTENATELHGRK